MNYEILLATNNKNKLKEIRAILSPHHIIVYGLDDLNLKIEDCEENGSTYYENALIKAKAAAKVAQMPIISDDSGLEIISLNREPGIYSARYAKKYGGYEKTFKHINEELKNKDKDAEFHCCIVLINVENKPLRFEGITYGKIVENKSNGVGFGYDPIFYVYEKRKTYSEMSEEEKNQCSHRAKALKKLITYLKINNLIKLK